MYLDFLPQSALPWRGTATGAGATVGCRPSDSLRASRHVILLRGASWEGLLQPNEKPSTGVGQHYL